MIKKFKNGKLLLKPSPVYDFNSDKTVNEHFYHTDMFMADLYLQTLDGITYLVDTNKQLCYLLGIPSWMGALNSLLVNLAQHKQLKLYPLVNKVNIQVWNLLFPE